MPIYSNTVINIPYISSPITINVKYFKSYYGILKEIEIGIGLICFILIIFSCRNYYDPFMNQVVGGFVGGKAEVTFLLITFTFLLITLLISFTILFSADANSSLSRNSFYFIYHLFGFVLYILSSLILMIEVISRNQEKSFNEPKYGLKVAASFFGLLNGLAYLMSTIFALGFLRE